MMQKLLDDLQIDSKSILIITPSELLEDTIDEIIKICIKENNLSTIFISLNKTYRAVEETLKKNRINKDLMFFIDCISKNGETKYGRNVHYIEDPSNLTKIGITVSQILDRITGRKALVIDELKTLLLYNELEIIVKFVRSIIGQTQKFSANVYIITTEDKELTSSIAGIFDKVIRRDVHHLIKHFK